MSSWPSSSISSGVSFWSRSSMSMSSYSFRSLPKSLYCAIPSALLDDHLEKGTDTYGNFQWEIYILLVSAKGNFWRKVCSGPSRQHSWTTTWDREPEFIEMMETFHDYEKHVLKGKKIVLAHLGSTSGQPPGIVNF